MIFVAGRRRRMKLVKPGFGKLIFRCIKDVRTRTFSLIIHLSCFDFLSYFLVLFSALRAFVSALIYERYESFWA